MRDSDIILRIIAVMIFVALIATPAYSDEPENFGRLRVIRLEAWYTQNGFNVYQYLVYDIDTKIVYWYIIADRGLSVTPYIMRDEFGQMTVGIYDPIGGAIFPAELYTDEEIMEIMG